MLKKFEKFHLNKLDQPFYLFDKEKLKNKLSYSKIILMERFFMQLKQTPSKFYYRYTFKEWNKFI